MGPLAELNMPPKAQPKRSAPAGEQQTAVKAKKTNSGQKAPAPPAVILPAAAAAVERPKSARAAQRKEAQEANTKGAGAQGVAAKETSVAKKASGKARAAASKPSGDESVHEEEIGSLDQESSDEEDPDKAEARPSPEEFTERIAAMEARHAAELERLRQSVAVATGKDRKRADGEGRQLPNPAAAGLMTPGEYNARAVALVARLTSRFGHGLHFLEYQSSLGVDMALYLVKPDEVPLELLTESAMSPNFVQAVLVDHFGRHGAGVQTWMLQVPSEKTELKDDTIREILNQGDAKNAGTRLVSKVQELRGKLEVKMKASLAEGSAADFQNRLSDLARLITDVSAKEAAKLVALKAETTESDRRLHAMSEWADAYHQLSSLMGEARRLKVSQEGVVRAMTELLDSVFMFPNVPDWSHKAPTTLAGRYLQNWQLATFQRGYKDEVKAGSKSDSGKSTVTPRSSSRPISTVAQHGRPETSYGRGAPSGDPRAGGSGRAERKSRPTSETHTQSLENLSRGRYDSQDIRTLEVCKDWNGLTTKACPFGDSCRRYHLCLHCVVKGVTDTGALNHRADQCTHHRGYANRR